MGIYLEEGGKGRHGRRERMKERRKEGIKEGRGGRES